VRRSRAVISVALALVALALMLAACGGGDEEETTTSPAPSEAPSEGATPPSPGALPPELVECYADKGFDIESPADIHSAPPQVVEACFESLHRGGGAP
jgi:hypothetical protein